MDNPTTYLVRYESARRALAEAHAVDEVKEIHDKAIAYAAYCHQIKNRELEIKAGEIRIHAERRLGQMLIEQKATVGMNPGTRTKGGGGFSGGSVVEPPEDAPPTLADVGIDKKMSSHTQKVAALTESDFEAALAIWRNEMESGSHRVSTSILKTVAKKEKQAQYEQKIADAHASLMDDGAFITQLDDLANKIADGVCEPFGTIYVDPPWSYQNQGTRASTDNHYNTMTIDEICALPVGGLAASESHLHLWTTNGFLFECPKIFDAWGFTFKSSFVWVKPQMGIGNYWRNAHEFLLLGVRGGQTALDRSLPSWLESRRTRHSEKPERIRELIQRLSPGPYLEIFGRKMIDGWVVFGNECDNPADRKLFRGRV